MNENWILLFVVIGCAAVFSGIVVGVRHELSSQRVAPSLYRVRVEGHDYYRSTTGNLLVHSEACPCKNPTNR